MENVPTNVSNLKSKLDKLDIDKLVPAPVDLSNPSDLVKHGLVKKDLYNAKTENIEDKIPHITNLATNTALNAKINEVKGKMASITNSTTTSVLNAKINEVKCKIPNITSLATTIALTAVENKIPSVSNLAKKDYNTKISEIENKITNDHDHDEYIAIKEFNRLIWENFTARLKQANLATKNDIANFIEKTDFDNKLKNVASNKNELNELSKKVKAIIAKGLTKDLINKFIISYTLTSLLRN